MHISTFGVVNPSQVTLTLPNTRWLCPVAIVLIVPKLMSVIEALHDWATDSIGHKIEVKKNKSNWYNFLMADHFPRK